jgi:hypothetical protein
MSAPDELAGTEQPFVQHLFELRDRLLRAVYGTVFAYKASMWSASAEDQQNAEMPVSWWRVDER